MGFTGFTVPRLDIGKDHKPQAGQDYEPATGETGYNPIINIHSNHSNLENGFYDPRLNLSTAPTANDAELHSATRRQRRASVAGVLVFVMLLAGMAILLLTR